MKTREIALQRATTAYDVLRGRPVRPDYGMLIVVPLLAAAGGALIALGVEMLLDRGRSSTTAPVAETADRHLESVSA